MDRVGAGRGVTATATLHAAGYLSPNQSRSFVSAYQRFSTLLDVADGSLLHADLDPGEVFVDDGSANVQGIVDWGDAMVGDRLMDLARFAAGGPAGDDGPTRLQPGLISAYQRHAGHFADGQFMRISLYRVLWSLRHARSYLGDPNERGWTPGLADQAIDMLADIDGGRGAASVGGLRR